MLPESTSIFCAVANPRHSRELPAGTGEPTYPWKAVSNQKEGLIASDLPPQRHLQGNYVNLVTDGDAVALPDLTCFLITSQDRIPYRT